MHDDPLSQRPSELYLEIARCKSLGIPTPIDNLIKECEQLQKFFEYVANGGLRRSLESVRRIVSFEKDNKEP